MAYPLSIDSFSTKANGDVIDASHVNDLQTSVVALETKVGITGSAVTASVDYKLTSPLSISPGHKHVQSDITDSSFNAVITMIPKTVKAQSTSSGSALVAAAISTNTAMSVGLVNLPSPITANKISFYVDSVSVAGVLKLAMFSEDGLTVYFSVSTASISASGVKTTALSSVVLPSGNYYIAILPTTTANISPVFFVGDADLLDVVSGETPIEGTLTVTANTIPVTITPTSISHSDNHTLYFRLDN